MAESQPGERPPWWRRYWLGLTVLGLIVLLAYAVLAVTVLPSWIISMNAGPKADDNTRLNAAVNTRGALLGLLATMVIAIGAVAAFLNYRVTERNLAETGAQNRLTYELSQKALDETQRQNRDTLDLTRQGQLTERFTKAIDQLGQTAEDKLDIRLGGIYALEQIARESAELHGPVMEILTAFLREHGWKPHGTPTMRQEIQVPATAPSHLAASEGAAPSVGADFQAIITVLGRRKVSHDLDGFRLDLRGVALRQVDVTGAQLQGAIFSDAQLQGARFSDAQLQGASFWGAQLQGADFTGTQLQGAFLADARLEGADFTGAQLGEAFFRGAQLQGASFVDAQLRGAVFLGAHLEGTRLAFALGLTSGQLISARDVDKASLPDYLTKAGESKRDDRPAE